MNSNVSNVNNLQSGIQAFKENRYEDACYYLDRAIEGCQNNLDKPLECIVRIHKALYNCRLAINEEDPTATWHSGDVFGELEAIRNLLYEILDFKQLL